MSSTENPRELETALKETRQEDTSLLEENNGTPEATTESPRLTKSQKKRNKKKKKTAAEAATAAVGAAAVVGAVATTAAAAVTAAAPMFKSHKEEEAVQSAIQEMIKASHLNIYAIVPEPPKLTMMSNETAMTTTSKEKAVTTKSKDTELVPIGERAAQPREPKETMAAAGTTPPQVLSPATQAAIGAAVASKVVDVDKILKANVPAPAPASSAAAAATSAAAASSAATAAASSTTTTTTSTTPTPTAPTAPTAPLAKEKPLPEIVQRSQEPLKPKPVPVPPSTAAKDIETKASPPVAVPVVKKPEPALPVPPAASEIPPSKAPLQPEPEPQQQQQRSQPQQAMPSSTTAATSPNTKAPTTTTTATATRPSSHTPRTQPPSTDRSRRRFRDSRKCIIS
ncbi:hypothetical protein EC973_003524 [Apophysomyces ossiformis]|uniref:Uncharacterized protein n=1 Tax=Apophysomyces ossiformis TaxID=679940 RepID=A0A8H7EMB3_9FUNG|nr:hypothetical protein EC973_003524 [Apophysomyces ossiformis]